MPKLYLKNLPWKWLIVSTTLILIDQFTKEWAIDSLYPRETVPIFPGLVLYLSYNPGIGFSLLSNNRTLLIFGTSVTLISITRKLYQSYKMRYSYLIRLGCSFILGGGLSNLYDRLTIGAVVDFISFYCLGWQTPIFNFADSFIIIGVLLIILSQQSLSLKLK